MALQLPPPLEALRTVALDIPCAGELTDAFWMALPTEAGVVLIEDENAKPILIRAIGDPRAFIRRRLQPDEGDPTPRLDYRAVSRRVSVIPTGHTLLAELVGAWCEASLDERLARATGARLSMCVVVCDPTARLPLFRSVEWAELWSGTANITRHERVIGPFANSKRAKRWIELIIDLFDLCRYDHLLAQTPNAIACVYKQMGKCPAPCDGSEPIESYRARFASASGFVGGAVSDEIATCEHQMSASAEKLDFERAAVFKERLQTLRSLQTGGPWSVCDLKQTVWQLQGPTRKSGWSRTARLDAEGLFLDADRPVSESNISRGFSNVHLLDGRTLWLLLATLTDCLQKGLAIGERVEQTVRESDPTD